MAIEHSPKMVYDENGRLVEVILAVEDHTSSEGAEPIGADGLVTIASSTQ